MDFLQTLLFYNKQFMKQFFAAQLKFSGKLNLYFSYFGTLIFEKIERYFSGVNFINVLRTIFLYECHFSSYVLALSKNLYKKRVQITLMKLTPGPLGPPFNKMHLSSASSNSRINLTLLIKD
jgi:hypothetical protein